MSISNLPVFLENAINLSRKLNTVWTSGDIQIKEDLQKLIFPEGIYNDRKTQTFRTEKVNFIFELIVSSSGIPPDKRKGTSYLIDYLSLSAGSRGLEPLFGLLSVIQSIETA
ncbi:hypothetical protein A4D02_18550 [Niastella koreensis]|uniref:Uncharacterized protein n=1 Tax=Niastella koreensis TaxID=354356 RepID=A0ABX3NNU9_9BACT|nr:hypothetical protein A4D02_18550 [Niastella koreensis]